MLLLLLVVVSEKSLMLSKLDLVGGLFMLLVFCGEYGLSKGDEGEWCCLKLEYKSIL